MAVLALHIKNMSLHFPSKVMVLTEREDYVN